MGFVSLLINVLNYVGIIAFATSGAFKAYEKGLDILGGIVLGSSVALAGGIIRDVLLGIFPPTNIVYLPYAVTAITASIVAYAFYPLVSRFREAFLYADAVGLGTFAAVGAEIAYQHSLNILGIILMAAITATGGGVVRDVLAGEVPVIFRRDIYATIAMLGGILYVILRPVVGGEVDILVTAVSIILVRFVIIMKGLDKSYVTIRMVRHGVNNREREALKRK
ncbi:MAG: trimeric intracellular cation channel family protein [Vulcanisaeta sp.]|nr:trimeric intracellular cation channel family protein [Vulcanisaeta sp.]